jgi:hypothetical protein
MMRILRAAALLIVFACFFAPGARAEYAVLRNGLRIHISGYENLGRILRLHVAGGTVDVAAEDVVNIEPEEVFVPAVPRGASAPANVRYPELINAAAQKYGLDAQLLAAVAAAESNFDARAVSRKNAQGVMQLLPETSMRLAVENPFDPAQSIDAGARYLKELLDRFHGDVRLALAAYNAGPERVDQFGGVPPYRETQDYVAKITNRVAQQPPQNSAQESRQSTAPIATASTASRTSAAPKKSTSAPNQPAPTGSTAAIVRRF